MCVRVAEEVDAGSAKKLIACAYAEVSVLCENRGAYGRKRLGLAEGEDLAGGRGLI